MFCINCGKQIVDTARFCNYCGTKVVNLDENFQQSPAENTENPIQIPVEDVKIPENVENSVDLLKMQNDVSPADLQMNGSQETGDTQFSEKETPLSDIQSGAVGAQRSAEVPPAPEQLDMIDPIGTSPEQPEQSVLTQPADQSAITRFDEQSAPITPAPDQPAMTQPDRQSERRYTIGHIIMCLASTALMAIAAGVFAGLYFSVV